MPNNKHTKIHIYLGRVEVHRLNILFNTYVTVVDYFSMKLLGLYLIPNPNTTLCGTKYVCSISQTFNPLFDLSTLNIVPQLLMLRDKETSLRIAPPHQHANLTSIPDTALVFGQRRKVLEEKARRRLHTLILNLPETNLIDDCGR